MSLVLLSTSDIHTLAHYIFAEITVSALQSALAEATANTTHRFEERTIESVLADSGILLSDARLVKVLARYDEGGDGLVCEPFLYRMNESSRQLELPALHTATIAFIFMETVCLALAFAD